ncbi:MAG: hypothetical protein J6W00_12115, partial [Lentisphaeria bacterium]|nr:hypothetical protein [Lentisphaeria bacterium]
YFERMKMKTGFSCNGREYKITKILHTQLYPNSRVKKQKFLLDGKELPEGEFIKRGRKLTCEEVYEVVSPVGLMDKLLKNPGKEIVFNAADIPAVIENSNFYTFTPDGTMYLDQESKFLEKSALRQLGFLQTQSILALAKNTFREYYIPKVNAFEQDKVKYDFAKGVDVVKKLPLIRFTGEKLADKNNLPERFIQIAGKKDPKAGKLRETGLVIGYSLRYGATRPEVRKNSAAGLPAWINVTQKSYPYVVQSNFGTVIEAGTVIASSGYRKLFVPEKFGKIAPASYTVLEKGKELLYLHFRESGSVEVPAKFTKVVEKSSNTRFEAGKASGSAGEWLVLE